MLQTSNLKIQEENDLKKTADQIIRNYKLYIICTLIAISIAFLMNQYSIPLYKITAAILIKDEKNQPSKINDNIKFDLFGTSQNFQNELEVIQSTSVMEQMIRKLNLQVSYYSKVNFRYIELYKTSPFYISFENSHPQPLDTKLEITFLTNKTFTLKAKSQNARFWLYDKNLEIFNKKKWTYEIQGKLNTLIKTPELCLMVNLDSTSINKIQPNTKYYFRFNSVSTLAESIKAQVVFDPVNKDATVIRMSIKTATPAKGRDILSGIMDVYSKQNLEKKNHLAIITLDYINQQLGIISDSLSQTEQKLQNFRSSNQLLNLEVQTSGITQQYQYLQNQLAETTTRKLYLDNLENNIVREKNITNIAMPSSLGISDPELNKQMSEFLVAQNQKTNLIENKQEKNPLVRKLTIQIENLRKVIAENITTARKTTEISIAEIKKRINKIEFDISRLPNTERQLVGIERKFRLNDAIYNYLMEKRSEANINKASNLPDNEIIELSKMEGTGPILPNKSMNYMVALFLGIFVPFSYLQIRSLLNDKIVSQECIERITDVPILGKILHNSKKSSKMVFDFPNSNISESYRSLRTNLDFYIRGIQKKVIIITSCVAREGKSFNALNIAMSYAQLGRKTILMDFDLRKPTTYYQTNQEELIGMSSYLINKATLDDIIIKSSHEKLDYIPSGPIPPNPAELIGLEKTKKLFHLMKEKYDYIIIDTPPIAQVTDAYLLLEYADINVLITRHNFTTKKIFSNIIKDLHKKNINNICIVLNDNRIYNDQYGYGYGYKYINKK